ncbi:hypothetical protein BGX34_008509 [Mortierella sp. NVP85]|nr:hypothetical protein BGX34_008509 [Mortierella sp. NVP85]
MNLAQAVASNDLAMARELCRQGHDPNQTFACSPRQSAYALQPIMGAHAQNFEPDDILYAATPLNLAVLNGNEDIVRALLDAGADLNKKDGRGRTPLLCAVYGLDTLTITPANLALISQAKPAHLSILRNCILPHPSITLSTLNAPQDEIKGITPLCLASYLGKDVIVKCLLEAGKVDVDATDRKGATALMYAARDKHMAVVKTLLRHGASPDLTDSNGWSSIQYGQMYPEIVQMFEETLRCKRPEVLNMLTPPESPPSRTAVSVLDRSPDGSSNALPHSLSQSLVRYPLYYSKLSSLLSSLPGAQANGKDASLKQSATGNNKADNAQIQRITHAALLEAIKLGDYMTLQSLLMAPPSLNDGSNNNNNNNTNTNGTSNGNGSGKKTAALVNHHDPQTGLTPLHHALRTRPLPSMETVKILYQAGADMNAQSHYGRTALHHLCRFSLEHALTLPQDDASGNNNASGATATTATTVVNGSVKTIMSGASSTSGSTMVEESLSKSASRIKNRHRTNTNGSGGFIHLAPHGREQTGSSAASTTSSNDLSSMGARQAHGAQMDVSVVKSASPEDVQRASKHLADCCRLLLRLGSLVNIQDRHGNTPLHFAVEYGGVLEVVRVLVQAGADNELRNTKGLKPMDVVRGEQSEEMRRILESGKAKPAGDGGEDGANLSKAVVPNYQTRDSILKPLNLPETLHEVDFQFNQVLQNLEHYQNHTSNSIETSLQYITDQILLGWSPDSANGHGQSQEEYNADLVASIDNLKYELESTYELLMITEEQCQDVVTFYESELDDMTRQNLVVLTAYDSEKSKVQGLYAIYTRLIEQLEELEAENEGLKTELEEKKRRGLASLGRLVQGAMSGEWTGARKASLLRKNNDTLSVTELDEEQLSQGDATRVNGPLTPAMVFDSPDTLARKYAAEKSAVGGDNDFAQDEREMSIPRPASPSLTARSSEGDPALHTIAVLSQKVFLLEQELSSKTCDIKERDLLVNELTDLIQGQSRSFGNEIKARRERIDYLMKILRRAEEGEQVQTLVDELAVKAAAQEDERAKRQRIRNGSVTSGKSIYSQPSGDWTFLKGLASGSKETRVAQSEDEIIATLKRELEISKTQIERLELANASLQERWQHAIKELESIRLSEAANGDQQGIPDGTKETLSKSTSTTALGPRVTKILVSKRSHSPQDEPLMITLDDKGNPKEEIPSLEEIELIFEILMANLAEISRDTEEAELRLKECSRAKEQIYKKCLYLDALQQKLDENVEKVVSQPVKADTKQPNFMEEQAMLQTQLDQLMEQAESVTNLYNKLKQDLQDYKDEKKARLRELDRVRDLMRKIGPQELLRGLLVKLEGVNPDDPATQRRREAIAAAVAQGAEEGGEHVASHLWRNSCSVVDEGDVQDAINSRLSMASIDHYTQSYSISDHKLFIQSLCSTLYALQMTTTHQIVSLKTSLAESRASLVLADQELSNLNDQIAGLYDDVGTLRNQLCGLQQELDRLIQHRKAEVEKIWEIVGEVRINNSGVTSMDEDETGSISSEDTHGKSSIKSRALAKSTRHSLALAAISIDPGRDVSTSSVGLSTTVVGDSVSNADGTRDSTVVARSHSISRAERASVLRNRISSPQTLSENDEESFLSASRASHEFSDQGSTSELDRHALISAEMDKLRSVHLHLLSTITEYKKQITVVKDRNLKLVATLLDRERVRLWTADGQDEVISAIVGQHGHAHVAASSSGGNIALNASTSAIHASGSNNHISISVGTVQIGEGVVSSSGAGVPSGGSGNVVSVSTNGSSSGTMPGAKKGHHLSLTAAEDGIKLLRCQLERIRQCEMTRFTEMGVGLTMNYGLYPSGVAAGAGSLVTSSDGV